MQIGEILLAHGLVTQDDLEQALLRQREVGGLIGENLIALGVITREQLTDVLHRAPPSPRTIAQTGISDTNLLNLMLKTIHTMNLETASQVSRELRLAPSVVSELIRICNERALVENLGMSDVDVAAEVRFTLSAAGRKRAIDALMLNQYVGPAPINLEDWEERIQRQSIANERISQSQIDAAFSELIIPETFVRRLGPAINSGRSILLYGPAGNGKTSVAERIAAIFESVVYIPYCVEVDGQIIKVFDPSVHQQVMKASAPVSEGLNLLRNIRREEFDSRWVACRRPVVITGGELTLEMLDLKYNTDSRFYEAPLHLKALNGTFIIDDFGRQLVSPEALLNRWIVPLQSRVDYMKLHTGKSFRVPFDELVIFSTNLSPADLMDPAFLRRIPFKLETKGPDEKDFANIFKLVGRQTGVEVPDDVIAYIADGVIHKLGRDLAAYQPKFVVDQAVAFCKFLNQPTVLRREILDDALDNMYPRPEEPITAKGDL